MPLRKLWNSIRGKSVPPTETAPPSPAAQPSAPSPERQVESPLQTVRQAVKSGPPGVAREHKKLCKRIESLGIQSVLEIGVGDGRRGTSLVSTLTRKGHSTPVHYIVVDQFEMGGESLSLRAFHKQLREYPAKVHLVPMDIDAGLDRVVRTYGQVDLIVWGDPQLPSESQRSLLARLSKPTTWLMIERDGVWTETRGISSTPQSGRRAA